MRKYEEDLESVDRSYHARYYKHFSMHENKGIGYRCEYCGWHDGENRRGWKHNHYSWKLLRCKQYKVDGVVKKYKTNSVIVGWRFA